MPSESQGADEVDQNEAERQQGIGERQAWVEMLSLCVQQLGYKTTAAERAAWIVEREQIVAILRAVCAEHGDNDWPDDLNLRDVIEKHLWRHL